MYPNAIFYPQERSLQLLALRELVTEQSSSECCSLNLLKDQTLWYKAAELLMLSILH